MIAMRCRLKVTEVLRTEHGEELKMKPVVADKYGADGLDENNTFAKFSPSGEFNLSVHNPELFGKFQPGEEYHVDFTKAEKPAKA